MQSLTLTRAEVAHIHNFIEELDALVDADDGTCFTCRHIDQLETIKEIVKYTRPEEEE
jgi:hypothetical protein